MVHSEASNKCRPKNWSGELSPSITGPMQKATDEIDNELGGNESDDYGKWSDMILNCLLSEFPPKIKSKA
jgi:hypothetical protein